MARLVIADDDPLVLDTLTQMLRLDAHDVRPVADGQRALAEVQADPPDLLLVDGNMPGLTGPQVAAAVHADPGLRHVPVVLLSADPQIHRHVGAPGIAAVVPKTARATTLFDTLDAVLSGSGSTPQLGAAIDDLP